MSRERIELSPATYEHRRRLVCANREENHKHGRVCWQKIRRGKRSRRRMRNSENNSQVNPRIFRTGMLSFSEGRMRTKENFQVKEDPIFEFSREGLDLLDGIDRRGARRFKRIVPFKPKYLPGPVRLPREGDQPVEPIQLPVRRKAA